MKKLNKKRVLGLSLALLIGLGVAGCGGSGGGGSGTSGTGANNGTLSGSGK